MPLGKMRRLSKDSKEGDLSTALWLSALVLSLGLAHSFYFTEATRALGQELGDTGLGRGNQDAVTPPWQGNLALAVYSLSLAALGAAWYEFGTERAIGTLAALVVGTLLWRRVLPRSNSAHYRKVMVASMLRRCAGRQKENDDMRGDAMAELLRKMGIDLPGMPPEAMPRAHPTEFEGSEPLSSEAAALLGELNALRAPSNVAQLIRDNVPKLSAPAPKKRRKVSRMRA